MQSLMNLVIRPRQVNAFSNNDHQQTTCRDMTLFQMQCLEYTNRSLVENSNRLEGDMNVEAKQGETKHECKNMKVKLTRNIKVKLTVMMFEVLHGAEIIL